MRLHFGSLVALLMLPMVAAACSFCGGAGASRNTLREEYAQAKAVVAGTLKNPAYDPDRRTGTTEFHFDTTLKTSKLIDKRSLVVLPKYIPVIGQTSPAYLMFFADADGQPDGVFGIPATPAVVEYLAGIAKLDATDPAKRLAFFFDRLDAVDATVSADAFAECAKATDAEVLKAKATLDPARLKTLLLDPKTPAERLGVFAMMLGLCGDSSHAAVFATLLKQPDSERVSANLGGLLAGLTLVDAKTGWPTMRAAAVDPKRPFDQRLSAVGAVKYFQAVRAKESKDQLLATYRLWLADADLADMAVDDLRRWGWWDLTTDVLALYARPTTTAPILKKGIVKYALRCPGDDAAAFAAAVKANEPKLFAAAEQSLRLAELPGK